MPRLMHRLHGGPPAHFCLHWRQAPLDFVSKEPKPVMRETHQTWYDVHPEQLVSVR